MKNRIIKIDSIEDIDTTRASVYDLSNRYIDKKGNMYGLRYNRMSRKVEIVKLMRSSANEAHVYEAQVVQQQKTDSETSAGDDAFADEETEYIEEYEEYFDPGGLIRSTLHLMEAHRDRLTGIIMNIKNSNVFPKENKTESIELENVFRNLEIDGIQQFEKVENYEKELTNYPRSLTYYQAKIDNEGRRIIEYLGNDDERIMRFVHYYEMYNAITALYRNLRIILTQLIEFTGNRDVESMKSLSNFEKQAYEHANVSLDNTMREIEEVLESMEPLDEFLREPSNI